VHPYLLHVGHLYLPTFGVLAAVGLMLALALSQYTATRVGIDPDALWDAGLFAILAAFVLSRLLLIVENFQNFLAYPILLLAVPSLTTAGLLLTAIASGVWLHFKRIRMLAALDAWAPCATLVWFFLALGHYAEGSDPGLPVTRPVALYVAGVAMALTAVLVYLGRGRASVGLVVAGTAQFLLCFMRQPGVQGVAGLDALQVVALGMVVAGCTLWLTAPSASA